MKLQRVSALVKVNVKVIIREPAALFTVILFPVVLTLFLGMGFGAVGGGQQPTFQVGIVDEDTSTAYAWWLKGFTGNLTSMQIINLQTYLANETAQADLVQGKIQAIILIPEGFGLSCELFHRFPMNQSSWVNATVLLYLDSGSMIVAQALPPIVQQALVASVYGKPQTDIFRPIQIGTPSMVQVEKFTMFDYMAPGISAFAAIFLIMNVAQSFTEGRERGLLRRINTTPTTPAEFMTSHAISNMLLALTQVALTFTTAYLVGYRPRSDLSGFAMAFAITSIFALCCVGFGLITATISRSSGAATGIAFLFILPQMMLGTYVSAGLSGSIKDAGRFVPSYYVTDALTSLFLRGAPITSPTILTDLAIVSSTSLIVLLLGVLLFKKYGKS